MLCAVSTKKRDAVCNTGNLGSTTDITVVVLQLTVQMGLLTQFRRIQTAFEEQQL